ncbi:MAG: DUF4345 domain-containing protein [Sphingobacteriales bacterium JAD_PAG50586_3]|nr:MAG: DUF4345 domain-containing protein [Sphingobacteriales bacterium JAD_PAG50586_3]
MKTLDKVILGFLIFVGLAFINVAVQAIISPQAVFDNVGVTLGNVSALNSIRANYGFVNLALGLFMVYGAFKMRKEALLFTAIFCWGFVIGRIYSIAIDGMPNGFVTQWLATEMVLGIIAITLLVLQSRQQRAAVV